MGDISYSSDALDTLPKFHRKDFVIFVEGTDDVPFWSAIFQAFSIQNYIIKPAGGTNEIEKYSQFILHNDVNIYVARDSDFKEILKSQNFHPRILWTYGHSIENTLYHPLNIAQIISIYARVQAYDPSHAEVWLNNFANEFKALLICEIGNEKFKKGIEILGSKCGKFLQANNSFIPSREMIDLSLEKILPKFSEEEYSMAENLLKVATNRKPIFFLIRGHFLTHAVTNFIKNEVRNISTKEPSFSQDNLFVNLVASLKSECLSNPTRVDIKYLRSQISTWISH